MSTIWFIKLNGLESPVNAGKLKEYASTGRIDPKTLVKKGETGQWVPASKIKGLVFKQPIADVEMQQPDLEETHEPSQEHSELNSDMVNQLIVDNDLHENLLRNLIDSEYDELDENLNFAAKQTFSENNFTVNSAYKSDTEVSTNSVQSIEEWTWERYPISYYMIGLYMILGFFSIPLIVICLLLSLKFYTSSDYERMYVFVCITVSLFVLSVSSLFAAEIIETQCRTEANTNQSQRILNEILQELKKRK